MCEEHPANESLIDWQLRYEAAVRAGRLILYDWDLASGEVTWGGEVETVLGYRRDEMGNARWALDQIHPEDRPRVEEAVRRIAGGGTSEIVHYRVRRKDGVYIHIEDCAEAAPAPNGETARLVGFVSDITDRVSAEHQLRELKATLEEQVAQRTAELEQRAAEIRELAEELSRAEQRERRRLAQLLHDHLQQLLIAAKLKIGDLRNEAAEELAPGFQNLNELLDAGLDASRSLTAQLSPPVLHEYGLAAALHWLAEWMGEKHKLRVEVEADERAEPADETMGTLLFEIVRELLLNASKHAQAETVRVRMARAGADDLEIDVNDDGVGFDPVHGRKRGSSAGGFGLSSIGRRLELTGGTLHITSAPGAGTQARVYAPRQPAEKRAADAGHRPTSFDVHPGQSSPPAWHVQLAGGGLRVLVVEDDEIYREGLAALLDRQADIEVVGQVADAQAAIDLCRRLRPELVVIDFDSPTLAGDSTCRQIVSELPKVCVVGLSTQDEERAAEIVRHAGGRACIGKNNPAESVLRAIRAAAS